MLQGHYLKSLTKLVNQADLLKTPRLLRQTYIFQ